MAISCPTTKTEGSSGRCCVGEPAPQRDREVDEGDEGGDRAHGGLSVVVLSRGDGGVDDVRQQRRQQDAREEQLEQQRHAVEGEEKEPPRRLQRRLAAAPGQLPVSPARRLLRVVRRARRITPPVAAAQPPIPAAPGARLVAAREMGSEPRAAVRGRRGAGGAAAGAPPRPPFDLPTRQPHHPQPPLVLDPRFRTNDRPATPRAQRPTLRNAANFFGKDGKPRDRDPAAAYPANCTPCRFVCRSRAAAAPAP